MKKVKRKRLNANSIVRQISIEAGVNLENATKIFNLISNLWTEDKIGLLSCLETGIPVKTKRRAVKSTKRKSAKRVVKKVVRKATKKVAKKLGKKKSTETDVKGTKVLGKVKTKGKNKKGKKKLRKGKTVKPDKPTSLNA